MFKNQTVKIVLIPYIRNQGQTKRSFLGFCITGHKIFGLALSIMVGLCPALNSKAIIGGRIAKCPNRAQYRLASVGILGKKKRTGSRQTRLAREF